MSEQEKQDARYITTLMTDSELSLASAYDTIAQNTAVLDDVKKKELREKITSIRSILDQISDAVKESETEKTNFEKENLHPAGVHS